MGYRCIVVPVVGLPGDEQALTYAFAAARPFAGHVRAIYIHPDPRAAVPFVGMPVAPEVVQEIVDSAEQLAAVHGKSARGVCEKQAQAAGVAMVERMRASDTVTCSFDIVYGPLAQALLAESLLADLVVIGTSKAAPDLHDAFIELLLKSHRPVLVPAEGKAPDLTGHVTVGWDGGATAAHALQAAVPLLKKAARVTLCCVHGPKRIDLEHPQAYLRLHGIEAGQCEIEATGMSQGQALIEGALRHGAGLLVAGGYGHSRLSETLFGGATLDLTAQTGMPLFLMH